MLNFLNDYSSKVNPFFRKRNFPFLWASPFYSGKKLYRRHECVRLQYSSNILRFKRCCWKETKKLLWLFFYPQKLREKRRKNLIFLLVWPANEIFAFLVQEPTFGRVCISARSLWSVALMPIERLFCLKHGCNASNHCVHAFWELIHQTGKRCTNSKQQKHH